MESKKTAEISLNEVIYDSKKAHYYLEKPADIAQFCEDYARIHQYPRPLAYVSPSRPELKKIQNKLIIAPVAALQNATNTQAFGVFTTQDIWIPPGKKQSLGFYEGEVLLSGAENPTSSCVFELPDDYVIDGGMRCNWTARVNGAISENMANVRIVLVKNKPHPHKIEYYLDGRREGLFLPKGSQLLVDYGSTEKYNHYEHKRALSGSDSWLDSHELLQAYSTLNLYDETRQKLPPDFLSLFKIHHETYFSVPKPSPLSDCFDLPYFAYSSCGETDELLPQNQQEHITPLMLACWEGNISRVSALLDAGSNPNMQSKISLFSAFHMVIFSRAPDAIKQQLIDLLCLKRTGAVPLESDAALTQPLKKNNLTLKQIDGKRQLYWWNEGYLMLQDQHEKSILHWAIEMDDEESVRYLINKEHRLFDDLDHNNRDPLECAIVHGNLNIINLLISVIDDLSDEQYHKLTDYFLMDDQHDDIRLIRSFNDLCETSSRTALEINLIFNALKTAFFRLIPKHAQNEMIRINNQPNKEEQTMPAKKRKFSPELKADELYNKSIDFADKADRLYKMDKDDNEDQYVKVLKYYQKALDYAIKAKCGYMSLEQHQHAQTTEQTLISPYLRKIEWLTHLTQGMEAEVIADNFFENKNYKRAEEEAKLSITHYQALIIEDEPDSLANQDIRESILKLQRTVIACRQHQLSVSTDDSMIEDDLSKKYAIVTPEPVAAPVHPAIISPFDHTSSFFQTPPLSLGSLKSLTRISTLEELPFFAGDKLHTVKEIQTQLIKIKRNLVLRIGDTSDTKEKEDIAAELAQMSLDFSTKLVPWSLNETLETSTQEQLSIALELISDAKTISSAAKGLYKLLECASKKSKNSLQYNDCCSKATEIQQALWMSAQQEASSSSHMIS